MICDICHENEAVLYVQQHSAEGDKSLNLCAECAKTHGLDAVVQRNKDANLGELFRKIAKIGSEITGDERIIQSKTCPVCNVKIHELLNSGITGCPECYNYFKDDIRNYLINKGYTEEYKGSIPKRLLQQKSYLSEKSDLQSKLNMALKNEDYEKAALYRDYIIGLENAYSSSKQEGENQ